MFKYSIVTPMYNVATYLPDYFASLQAQTIGFDSIQVVLVDDGSTDDGQTRRLAQDFASQHPDNVVFISQPNGGQASARNSGLARATGEWITFPDPDDVVNPEYFEAFERALDSHPDADVVSAKLLLWYEATEQVKDNHALAKRFHHGVTLRRLDTDPEWIQPHVTSALLRRSVIAEAGLRFPETLRYRFEDGCFISDYLLRIEDPTVLFVPDAQYHYRQRADQSSTVQATKANPAKYTEHLRFGFEYLIEVARRERGAVPRWLQNLMLYDQFWILRASQGGETRNAVFPAEMYEALDELIPSFLQHVDDEAIENFSLMHTVPWMREALLLTKGSIQHGPVYVLQHDGWRGLRAYVYRYGAARPSEQITTSSGTIEPHHVKDQGLEYTGRPLVWQRTLWLPDDVELEISLNGQAQEILHRPHKPTPAYGEVSSRQPEENPQPNDTARPETLAARADTSLSDTEPEEQPRIEEPRRPETAQQARSLRSIARDQYKRTRRRAGRVLRRAQRAQTRFKKAIRRRLRPGGLQLVRRDIALHSSRLNEKFRDAWVFIDRDVDANDSAEDLYFWVKENHPEVNSWFVIRRASRDWTRLQKAGARLVPYGEPEFYMLLSNASYLASSHADRFITDALPRKIRANYTFVFLQHGVIKGDISGWLNAKRIGVFITSTEAEYRYITGPSPYKFSTKEVRLTGLPRHDALLAMQEDARRKPPRKILIMPTWRNYLVSGMTENSGTRDSVAGFAQTAFARNWHALLHHPSLLEAANAGYEVIFMPHPNMQGYLNHFEVPEHVRSGSYASTNVREVLVQAAALITDYSSMAFNAAYLRIPVVYFQFDRLEYRSGHTERDGYFDYTRDGFGPVATTIDVASSALRKIIAKEFSQEYYQRMANTFPQRDGRNCERVYRAMLHARRRLPEMARQHRASSDSWHQQPSRSCSASQRKI